MTAPARPGTLPTLAERFALLEKQVTEQAAVIAMLVAAREAEDHVDGDVPVLSASWVPLKRAVEISGYSASALRKLKAPHWWKYVAGRVWIDTSACPRKVRTRTATRTFAD